MENGRLYNKRGRLVDEDIQNNPPYGQKFFDEFFRRYSLLERNPDYIFVRLLAGKMNQNVQQLLDTEHLRDLERREEQLRQELAAERRKLNASFSDRMRIVDELRRRQTAIETDMRDVTETSKLFDACVDRWWFLASTTGFPLKHDTAALQSFSGPLPYWLLHDVISQQYDAGELSDSNALKLQPKRAMLEELRYWRWEDSKSGGRRRGTVLKTFYDTVLTMLDQRTLVNDADRLGLLLDIYLYVRDVLAGHVIELRPDPAVSDASLAARPRPLFQSLRELWERINHNASSRASNSLLSRDGDADATSRIPIYIPRTPTQGDMPSRTQQPFFGFFLDTLDAYRNYSFVQTDGDINRELAPYNSLQEITKEIENDYTYVPTMLGRAGRPTAFDKLLKNYKSPDPFPQDPLPLSDPEGDQDMPRLLTSFLAQRLNGSLQPTQLTYLLVDGSKTAEVKQLLYDATLKIYPFATYSDLFGNYVFASFQTDASAPPQGPLCESVTLKVERSGRPFIEIIIPLNKPLQSAMVFNNTNNYAERFNILAREIAVAFFLENNDNIFKHFFFLNLSNAETQRRTDRRDHSAYANVALEMFFKNTNKACLPSLFIKEMLRSTFHEPQRVSDLPDLIIDGEQNRVVPRPDMKRLYVEGSVFNNSLTLLLPYAAFFTTVVRQKKLNRKRDGKQISAEQLVNSIGELTDEKLANLNVATFDFFLLQSRSGVYETDKSFSMDKEPNKWGRFWTRVKASIERYFPDISLTALGDYTELGAHIKHTSPDHDFSLDTFSSLVDTQLERMRDADGAIPRPSFYDRSFMCLFEVMALYSKVYAPKALQRLRQRNNELIRRRDVALRAVEDLTTVDYQSAAAKIDDIIANAHHPSSRWMSLPEILGRIILTPPVMSGIQAAAARVGLNPYSPLNGVPTEILTGNTLNIANRPYIVDTPIEVVLALTNAFATLVAAEINSVQQRWPSAYNTKEQNRMAAADISLACKALGGFRAFMAGPQNAWTVHKIN